MKPLDEYIKSILAGRELGREADCRAAVRELLDLKPDFQHRGHVLIGRYVRFTELQRKIVDALAVGGLSLDAKTP